MKIIKEGKLPELKVMEGECNHCRCQIECVLGEAQAVPDGRNGTDYKVMCPTDGCNKVIWVKIKTRGNPQR